MKHTREVGANTMKSSPKECTALCRSFRCDRHPDSLEIRGNGSKRQAWCTWIDEECDGAWCVFSKCQERRLLDNGYCRPVKKDTPALKNSAVEPIVDDFPDAIPKEYAKKLRGKGL
ncbi:MAG: hypothetical protein DRO87_05765 [Candidatus Thorarchaeota archaeon]|nr:MAG: hypothetical protein DRP09_02905 [Candidatus Thorarchaeota archaeon]RLI58412.1 MAG: hypothetical protein DRO87_05765 [Candidatus Thorarchaeota archaeon]